MKKLFIISTLFAFSFGLANAQTKEIKAGHVISINVPNYMFKTAGLNTSAIVQFKNSDKDVYGYVIEDSKEDLTSMEMSFASTKEFYDAFINDFVTNEPKRKVGKPIETTKGDYKFIETDLQYFDKDAKIDIYFSVGIVETPTHYYKVLCWTTLANKNTYKPDFQKIIYSLKD